MSSTLEVSRTGFYAWLGRGESKHTLEDRRLTVLIREDHEKSRGTYGSPRIHAALKKRGEVCGLLRVERLMREAGIRSQMRRKFQKTTDSKNNHPVAPNLLDQDFSVSAPNQVWVSDISTTCQRSSPLLSVANRCICSHSRRFARGLMNRSG